MRGKLLFVAGIAVGYVLGARAGRQRYEQIKSAAEGLWNTPTVQKGVDSAKEFALSRVGDVSDSVLDGVKKLVNAATNTQKPSQKAGSQKVTFQGGRPSVQKTPTTRATVGSETTGLIPDPEDPAGPAPTTGAKTTKTPKTTKTTAASDPE